METAQASTTRIPSEAGWLGPADSEIGALCATVEELVACLAGQHGKEGDDIRKSIHKELEAIKGWHGHLGVCLPSTRARTKVLLINLRRALIAVPLSAGAKTMPNDISALFERTKDVQRDIREHVEKGIPDDSRNIYRRTLIKIALAVLALVLLFIPLFFIYPAFVATGLSVLSITAGCASAIYVDIKGTADYRDKRFHKIVESIAGLTAMQESKMLAVANKVHELGIVVHDTVTATRKLEGAVEVLSKQNEALLNAVILLTNKVNQQLNRPDPSDRRHQRRNSLPPDFSVPALHMRA